MFVLGAGPAAASRLTRVPFFRWSRISHQAAWPAYHRRHIRPGFTAPSVKIGLRSCQVRGPEARFQFHLGPRISEELRPVDLKLNRTWFWVGQAGLEAALSPRLGLYLLGEGSSPLRINSRQPRLQGDVVGEDQTISVSWKSSNFEWWVSMEAASGSSITKYGPV